jgi:hypothetical protein
MPAYSSILVLNNRSTIDVRTKAAGKYRGRAPTADIRANEVLSLHEAGMQAKDIKISLASTYRIIATIPSAKS